MNGSKPISLPAWINALSLDAPIVAMVWQAFFARLLEVRVSLAAQLVLGMGVWLAYVADRWLDGRKLRAGMATTLRHRFAQKQARPIAVAWALVFTGAVILAVIGLSRREMISGMAMAAPVVAYLAAVQSRQLIPLMGWLKELLVALLFSGGCMVLVTAQPQVRLGDVPPLFVSLFAVSLLNCLTVSTWDQAADARQAQPSMAIRCRISTVGLTVMGGVFMSAFVVMAVLRWHQPAGLAAAASVLSVTVLLILNLLSGGSRPSGRRLAADIALLSPMVVWPFLR